MLYRASVFLHVLAACVWVGGIAFFVLVLVPALRGSRDPKTMALVQSVGLRFRTVGWASLGVLIVTGSANVWFRVPAAELIQAAFWTSAWGSLLSIKLGLVAIMLVVSALHDWLGARATRAAASTPDARDAPRLRLIASRLGRALGVLVLAIVLVAVLLVRGY